MTIKVSERLVKKGNDQAKELVKKGNDQAKEKIFNRWYCNTFKNQYDNLLFKMLWITINISKRHIIKNNHMYILPKRNLF